MNNNPIFNIGVNGSYPNETYSVTPKTDTAFINSNPFPEYPNFNGFWSNLGTNLTRSFLNYHRNPIVPVIDATDYNYRNYIYYTNATYLTATNYYDINLDTTVKLTDRYIERVNTISFLNNSIITFDISSLRKTYKTPYEFNFFYFRTGASTGNSYGYLLYPNRIFLNPTNLSYNSGTNRWSLTTKAQIISSAFVSISQSTSIEKDAFASHKQRLNTLPTLISMPSGLNSNQFTFDLKACRSQIDYPVITFGSTVGAYSATKLDTNNDVVYVNPDTTFISFSASFYPVSLVNNKISRSNNTLLYLNQTQLNDILPLQTFCPTFIPKYNQSTGVQTFELIQQGLNPNTLTNQPSVPLSDTTNCVLSATIDNNGNFIFSNPYTPVGISFKPGSYIGVNYIADCTNLIATGGSASSSLNSFTVNGVSKTLNTNIVASDVGANDIVWETNYPPHCYTYKIKLLDSTGATYLDSNSLNFYVKLSAFSTLNTATLSAYIGSDFNALKYGFNDSNSEYISYQIINTSLSSIDLFLQNVTCTYGNNQPYTLTNSNSLNPMLVPVSQGKDLKITYSGVNFVGISFTVKATLQTAAGELDQFEPFTITLGVPNSLNGNKIFIDVLNEKSNQIIVDSSFNTTATSWPSRDLRDSKILWDWNHNGNKDLPVVFNYVDYKGNYIAPVNGETYFGDKTWTVSISGYGPNPITISLSSQKYNETVTKQTNPLLYNFLQNGQFLVTPLSDLNNLNLTRTIKLKVQVPYGNQIFDIPSSIPIYWTWEYDDIKNADYLPITANQILNNNKNYTYSSNLNSLLLSAIQINVTPGYSKTIPKIHKVKVIAHTDIVSPPVTGSYTFYVDDFPDPSIFNSDFATYYSDYTSLTSFQIANTRYGKNTITRPNGYDLNCTFIANNDVLPKIKSGTKYWALNDIQIQNTADTYTLDLNNPNLGLSTSVSYGYPITSAKIGLNLYSAIAPGWTSAHNVSATTNFYILSSTDFYNPLNFIIYPEYAWIQPDPTHVTLLSTDPTLPSYYTNSYRPSAYGNKKSNSQTFWLSANKTCFDEYVYQNMDTYNMVQTSSSYDLLDIPYNPYSIATSVGIPISLVGYNNTFYPENFDIKYNIIKNINGTKTLVTEYHTISTKTIDFTEPTNNVANNFFLSPIILPYNYLTLDFTPNQTDINLDVNRNISITQNLNTLPLNQPSVIVGGTITYYLSSHFWTVSATVPAINGTYSLFNLQIGDPSIPLNSGDLGKDYFYLYAKTNVIQQIPSTTFDNYSIIDYSKDRNLWNPITI